MLQNILLNNLAIIDTAQITFNNGITVLGGESGAGKSLFFKAIELVSGSGDIKPFIHEDDDSVIKATFSISASIQKRITKILEKYDIDIPISDKISIQRTIRSSATTEEKIEGVVISAEILRKISEHLLIYSKQNQHLALDRSDYCFELIDRYGQIDLEPIQDKYHAILALYRKKDDLSAQLTKLEKKLSSYDKDIQYIEDLEPRPEQYEKLKELATQKEFLIKRIEILLPQYLALFGSSDLDVSQYRRTLLPYIPRAFKRPDEEEKASQRDSDFCDEDYSSQNYDDSGTYSRHDLLDNIRHAADMTLPEPTPDIDFRKQTQRKSVVSQQLLEKISSQLSEVHNNMWQEIEYIARELRQSGMSDAIEEYEKAEEACDHFSRLLTEEEYEVADDIYYDEQLEAYKIIEKRHERKVKAFHTRKAKYDERLTAYKTAKENAEAEKKATHKVAKEAIERASILSAKWANAVMDANAKSKLVKNASTEGEKKTARLAYREAKLVVKQTRETKNQALEEAKELVQTAKKAAKLAAKIKFVQRNWVLPSLQPFSPKRLDRNILVWEKIIEYPKSVAQISSQKRELIQRISSLKNEITSLSFELRSLGCNLMHTRERCIATLEEEVQDLLRDSLAIPHARISIMLTPSHTIEEALKCPGIYERTKTNTIVLTHKDERDDSTAEDDDEETESDLEEDNSESNKKNQFSDDYKDITLFIDENLNCGYQISFYFSANPDESKKKVSSVASGGELSRLNFAIQYELVKKIRLDTFIMDEIDAGISGTVAISLAQKVKEIAKENIQVLIITHTAAVAAIADEHYHISKDVKGDETEVSVHRLNLRERVEDLSKIMSGKISHDAVQLSLQLLGLPKNVSIEDIPNNVRNVGEWEYYIKANPKIQKKNKKALSQKTTDKTEK